ncbi:hypothetical protein [Aneurinibacillus terranovensis]|uniref:hypothetical protein n=1 Tax=Aneurinibacillus terranovensis TaxID=278991 RepID=UPI00041BA89C|nr:hypothetical protein [Aneurinibacillus terranovensis]
MKNWRTHPLYVKVRSGASQLLIPFIVFQLARTLIFPTAFDVLILIILVFAYSSLLMEWI